MYSINRSTLPHGYYPRPQLMRSSYICLNGPWDFAVTKDTYTEIFDKTICVPYPPESKLSGLQITIAKDDYMHYKRVFELQKPFEGYRAILHFGAIDSRCEVYLNQEKIGSHTGGYIPFRFDVTDYLCDGSNTLYIVAKDGIDKTLPYGKQTYKRGGMWYTPVSGIWQTVWIEIVPENYISDLHISTTTDTVTVKVMGASGTKRLTFEDGSEYSFDGDSITVVVKDPKLWSPESPNIYRFTIRCEKDVVESYFALREISVKNYNGQRRLCLNGKPYLFNGLLDQGYFQDGIFLPESLDGYLKDIRLAKRLGFNMLRKHIKIEPMIFYYLCDIEGIAVFQDMVNNSDYSFIRDTALPTIGIQRISDTGLHKNAESRANFEEAMEETARLLHNTPSVLYYTIFNEGWGQFNSDEMYEKLKSLDESRIIDSTSGWFRRSKTDVDSRHVYFKKLNIKKRTSDPLVISEFGGYSYREPGHVFSDKNYGYKTFDSREELTAALQRLYLDEVIPLIKEGCDALVYTQVSDVEDETNGLITYDREIIKVDEEKIADTMDKIKQYYKKLI